MGGANSAVSAIAAYMTQGAAANVSNVSTQKNSSKAAATSFDNILNKVSDTFIQTKTVDVSKDVNKQLASSKETTDADTKTVNLKDMTNNAKSVNENPADTAAIDDQTAVNETNNQVPMEPTEQAPQTPLIPEAAPATEVTAQTEVDTSKANEVTVINTQKEKKGGSLALIILLGLLVLFVFNIDYVISLYDSIFNKTVVTKKPTGNNDSNNLFNGFILIGEESYAITDNIKFYSFKKSSGILNFTYN